MRNDGDADEPGSRRLPGPSIESLDPPVPPPNVEDELLVPPPTVEDELLDRILRSTALRSVRSLIAMGGAGKALEGMERNGKDLIARALDRNRRSYFDCNICFEAASDPVLTSCGHLFCWPCLYRWLHFDWDANECPVCEGEVSETSLIPIYGRGESGEAGKKPWELELGLAVPPRPRAKRVESSRQRAYWRNPSWGIEEAIRRISNRAMMFRQWFRSSRRFRGLGSGEREETTHSWRRGVSQDERNGGPINEVGSANGQAAAALPEAIRSAVQQADGWLLSGGALQDNSGDGRPGGSAVGIRDSILGSVLNPQNWLLPQRPVEVAVSGVEFPSPAGTSAVEQSFGTLHVNLLMPGRGDAGEARESVSSNAAVLQMHTGRFDGVSELDSAGSVPSLEGRRRRRRRNNENLRYVEDGIPPVSRRRRSR